MPGPTFGFVKPLASSGSHCTKWADEQHWQAGFESRLLPDLPLPFIPTLIGLRAFDLVSSRVWWEAVTNTQLPMRTAQGFHWSRRPDSSSRRRRKIFSWKALLRAIQKVQYSLRRHQQLPSCTGDHLTAAATTTPAPAATSLQKQLPVLHQ